MSIALILTYMRVSEMGLRLEAFSFRWVVSCYGCWSMGYISFGANPNKSLFTGEDTWGGRNRGCVEWSRSNTSFAICLEEAYRDCKGVLKGDLLEQAG